MQLRGAAHVQQYVDAAEVLRQQRKKLTIRTLAGQLGKNWRTVESYLRRRPQLSRQLGVIIVKQHGVEDYLTAIKKLKLQNRVVTQKMLAHELGGKSEGTVSVFLLTHPGVREALTAPYMQRPAFKRSHTVTYMVWDERIGRLALVSVGLAEYVRIWDRGLLKFQREKTQMPDYLPTREEASALL